MAFNIIVSFIYYIVLLLGIDFERPYSIKIFNISTEEIPVEIYGFTIRCA